MKKPTPKRRGKNPPHRGNDAEKKQLLEERALNEKLKLKLEKKLQRTEKELASYVESHRKQHERIRTNHSKILCMAGPAIETIQRACEMQRTILHGLRFNIDGAGVGLTSEATIAQLQLAIKLINQILLFEPESGRSHDPSVKAPIGHENSQPQKD